jgi:AraC-like DNA-binding protein
MDAVVAHLAPGDHRFPMHVHEDWSFAVVHSGQAWIATRRGREVAGAGAATVLHPDQSHEGRVEGLDYHILLLPERLVTELLPPGASSGFISLIVPAGPVWRVIRVVAAPPGVGEEERRERTLAAAVALFSRAYRLPGLPRSRALARSVRARLDACIEAKVSVQALAREHGVSPGTVIRAFAADVGLSPYAYVVSRRVDLARRLLRSGVPPAQAALQAGFYDQAHLTRHFLRQVGTTAARYA